MFWFVDVMVDVETGFGFKPNLILKTWAGGPAGYGHSKLTRAHSGLPLTSVQFISVTEVVMKFVTKKRNEFFLRRPLMVKIGHMFIIGM